jgi:hypothetical protein
MKKLVITALSTIALLSPYLASPAMPREASATCGHARHATRSNQIVT